MPASRRRFAQLAGAALLAGPAVSRSQAGWKAGKPITIYNPFAAGGGTDIHLRLLGERAGPILGQPILVDSRPAPPARWRRRCCSTPSSTVISSPA